jgi:hypothetical protein
MATAHLLWWIFTLRDPPASGGRRVTSFAPVYGWFTEGLDTPDLIEAKALLDEVA